MMKSIPYGRQFISDEDIDAVVKTLKSDFLTQGPRVIEFEQAFAQYVGSKYAVAVSNGTAALHLGAMALNVKNGQKVITTPITFSATANCVKYCGGDVVFADINPETYLLDIEQVQDLLDSSDKGTYQGIIPVSFTGYPVDLQAFRKLADEHNLWLMEDACHAPGAWFTDSSGHQQNVGNGAFADLSIFSFHPVKHIASGEGGMITTNNKQLYEQLLRLRTHGITKEPELLLENHGGWYYELQELGYNYRITDIQASLGNSQLKRADEGLKRRIEIAKRYDDAFRSLNIVKQKRSETEQNAFHLYVVEVSDRKGLYDYLKKNGIYAQVHYIPLHKMPYYRQEESLKTDLPNAEGYYERCLSIPMYPSLLDEEVNFVIEKVLNYLN